MRKRIGLLIGEQDAHSSFVLVNSIYEVAAKYDYDVFIFSNFGTYDNDNNLYSEGEMSIYKIPILSSFDGFVINETLFNIDGMGRTVYDYFTRRSSHNVVYLKGRSEKFTDIMLDDKQSIKNITNHFIKDHGFKDIYFMTGRWELQDARDRYAGYEEAMEEAGLDVYSDMVFYGNYWKNMGKEAVDFFLNNRKGKYPEAIVCSNDYMALSVIDELLERGIRVPEDICVSGYDNEEDSRLCSVPITTIDPDLACMGRTAMETLHKKICGEQVEKIQYLSSTPIYRQSCGCGECVVKNTLETRYRDLERHYYGIDMSVYMFNGYQVSFDISSILTNADKYFVYNFAEQTYLCLCDDALDSINRPVEKTSEYTFNMELKRIYYKDSKQNYDSPEIIFQRKSIIPEEYLDTPKPMKYYVNSIHCQNKVYGYLVSIYADNQCPYHFTQSYTMALGNALDEYNIRKKYLGMDEIKNLYMTDELTGISNRRGFEQAIANILDRSKREHLYLSIASIDMDGLKEINDTYGHDHGDVCLRAVADALKSVTYEYEAVARYGGDEFVAFLVSESDPERHKSFEHDLLEAIDRENEILCAPYTVHASIGTSPLSAHAVGGVTAFYKKADKIMYENKAEYKKKLEKA